jgi:hypothetical protein
MQPIPLTASARLRPVVFPGELEPGCASGSGDKRQFDKPQLTRRVMDPLNRGW